MTAILIRNGPSNILFFTFREEIKNYIPSYRNKNKPDQTIFAEMVRDFISGSCVGAFISTVFYPINIVRTQMQTQPPGSRHLNFVSAFFDVYNKRDRNIRKLFRGVHINYSRSFLSWGIINACYEFFHKIIENKSGAH